ncbi:hypothetical protein ACJRO7_008089 [Eucalyptus globulus]|uniref:DUF4283 domain-containing protein n=1 Tax=Eucalyptus globulus TaxID=34317 RepID=A0ABD3IQG4_EUCGL
MASTSEDPLGRGKGKPQAPNARSRSRVRYVSRGRDTRRPNAGRNRSNVPQNRSWAKVASLSTKGYDLDFAPPISVGRKSIVRLSDNAKHAGDPKWDSCLVGYYVGKNIPFKITETALKHAWGSHLAEVLANDDGFYFFIIPDDEFRRRILDECHITVARVPLVLKQWHCDMELKKDLQSSVPVWIRLKNIPFAYWSAPGISEIASAIGRPLYVDPLTEKMKRLSFARVCVEISAKLERCEEVEVLVDDKAFSVAVLYEWRPNSCAKCCVFGHDCLTKEVPKMPPKPPATIPTAVEPTDTGTLTGNSNHHIPPIMATDIDLVTSSPSDDGWKQVSNRKKRLNVGQSDKAVVNPPISVLKAPSIENQAIQIASDDHDNPNKGENTGSMALVVPNPAEASAALSSEEESEDEANAVNSSSSEGEDPVNVAPECLNDPYPKPKVPPNRKTIPKAALETPASVSKGSSRRKPFRRRGLGSPVKQAEVRNFVRSNNLYCVGIVETKISVASSSSVSPILLPGWRWVYNYSHSHKGRIWVGWNPRVVDFLINSASSQAIHGRLLWLPSGTVLFLSVIYAEHSFVARRPLWEDLIQSSGTLSSVPWIVAGDFNAIRDPSDRMGGSNAWIPAFEEFRDCLNQAGLEDLRFTGYRYTWAASSGTNRKQRKIDRVLVNGSWNSAFSFSEASFLAPGISDHTPMVVKVMPTPKTSKPFKFFNFWMTHPDYARMVVETWDSPFYGSPMFILYSKLRLLKCKLKQVNRESFSDLSLRTAEARRVL